MHMVTPVRFIEELDIVPGEAYSKKRITKGGDAGLPVKDGQEQSFFSEKSLLSFAAGVSASIRNDVLQSTLLAQMAANKQVPDQDKIFDWYKVFMNILGQLGWLIEDINTQNYKDSATQLELDNLLIDILTAAFGGNYINVLKKTLEAIKGMTDEDRQIKAFEKNTRSVSQRGFQIALANETNGAVSMQVSTFMLDSSLDLRRILFVKRDKENTSLRYLIKRATFNTASYDDDIRKAVNAKIKDTQLTSISEISI